jgi:hypothetical protein
MRLRTIKPTAAILAILLVASTTIAGPIESRISPSTLTLPQSLEASSSSWCTWTSCTIGPRLYLAPRSDGSYLVGWTDNFGNGHVSTVSGSSISVTHNFAGSRVRGLVAHIGGAYAVLLKNGANLSLSKRAANGSATWTTPLNSTIAEDSSTLGGHRLTYGGGYYAAYWAVHGISGIYAGHEGDQLTFVNDSGAIQGGGWNWGCSHSMAELVGYHSHDAGFTAFCSTDCYPNPPGLTMNRSTSIYQGEGNCGGLVSVQLGQMAEAETGWKIVFNAQDTVDSVAFGVGLATVVSGFSPSDVWLTATNGTDERDPAMARIGSGTPEQYLVGWRTKSNGAFHIGVIDASGAFLEGPEQMGSTGPGWGNRDDSFQRTPDGAVAWIEGNSGSVTITLYRYSDSAIFADGFESGDSDLWSTTAP